MSKLRRSLAVGLTLILFPIAVQIPFGYLAATYSYPDILERPPAEVLARFHDGGSTLVVAWYAYAVCTLGLGFLALELPAALGARAPTRATSLAGAVAAVAQFVGLLRWTMVVPMLADRWTNHPEERPTIELAYELQHRLFGVMLGEHVGQLAMGVFTLLAATAAIRAGRSRIVAAIGCLAGALFVVGLGAQLARVLPMPAFVHGAPLLAFVAWSIWAVATGVSLIAQRVGVAG